MRLLRSLALLLLVLPGCARGVGAGSPDAGPSIQVGVDAGPPATVMDASVPTDAPAGCLPSCAGRTCGDDGCGGSCGTCSTGTCVGGTCSCTPNCTGRTCGDDGCGGSCGTCGTLCTDTCTYAFDFDCDDGGPLSDYSLCDLGTDCGDCGPRTATCVSGACVSP